MHNFQQVFPFHGWMFVCEYLGFVIVFWFKYNSFYLSHIAALVSMELTGCNSYHLDQANGKKDHGFELVGLEESEVDRSIVGG